MKLAPESAPQQRKQIAILAVLVIVAGYLFYSQFGGPAEPVTTEAGTAASNTAAQRGTPVPAGALPEPLRLAALEPVPVENTGARNPFGFGVPPAPPPPPPKPYVPPPPPVVQAPPTNPGPPQRPKIPVKFLGVAEDPARPGKIASLSINGIVMLAREGDIVDGRYRLVKIGEQSIVMTYLDGKDQQVIQQSGT